jgi:hypothetical protein
MNPLGPQLKRIVEVLLALDVRFAICGSIASSAWGIGRTTFDADVVVNLPLQKIDDLAAALGKSWYADTDLIRSSIRAGRSYNLIHMPTGQKIDFFPPGNPFQYGELARAKVEPLELDGPPTPCPITTAEDTILAKLRWYRDGGEASERQWLDVLGILAVQLSLDHAYLDSWAARLGVSDLLAKARACANSPG